MGELTITRMTQARIPTAEGEFQAYLYLDRQHTGEHLAFVLGPIVNQPEVLVRVHSECFTGDVLGSLRCDCGAQLAQAVQLIGQEGAGIIIYLRQEGRGIGLLDKLRAYNLQDQGYDTVEANLLLGHSEDERDYDTAALILKDLGVSSVRLLTNNPLKITSLQACGIRVAARVPLPPRVTTENATYLLTKAQRMHHLLNLEALAGVLSGSSNGSKPEPLHCLAPTARARVHSASDGATARPRPVETAGWMPLEPEEGMAALVQNAAEHYRHTGRPFVTLSYAQSVDGSIAAHPGQTLALSGGLSMTLTHRLRAAHDAILVGIGTILSDNPRLTVRLVAGKNPQPIVADSRLRFPLSANLLCQHPLSPWIAAGTSADASRQHVLEAAGARVLRLPMNARGQVNLTALLERLGTLGIRSVMVEGGARIITSFLAERLVDHIVLTVAPRLVGGIRAVRRLAYTDPVHLPRLRNLRYQRLEEDLVLWCDPAWEEE
jgi:3,4-dihydroxy 2-butanone 4-phosphate synthase/GTP cyclohydrolase II